MKVEVTKVFFDGNGLHKKGDIIEVAKFQSDRMKLIETKTVEVKEVKKETKSKGKK